MDQLTKDALAANEAGMTYGKYMLIKPKKDLAPQIADPDARFCVVCGKQIFAKDKFRRKTCGDDCRTEWSRILARRRGRAKRAEKRGYGDVNCDRVSG